MRTIDKHKIIFICLMTLLCSSLPIVASASTVSFDDSFVYLETDLKDLRAYKLENNEPLNLSVFELVSSDEIYTDLLSYDFKNAYPVEFSTFYINRSSSPMMLELSTGERFLVPARPSFQESAGSENMSPFSLSADSTTSPDVTQDSEALAESVGKVVDRLDGIGTLFLTFLVVLCAVAVCIVLFKAFNYFF